MDMQMPEMDGIEATKHIRQHENKHRIPTTRIIALTANAMSEDEARCLQAGMNDFVAKPITNEALETALAQVQPV